MEIWAWIMIILIGLLAVISFKWFLNLEDKISSENTRLEKFIENTRRDSERELTIIRKALISNNTDVKELKAKSQEKERADKFFEDYPKGLTATQPEYDNTSTIYYSYVYNDKVNHVKLGRVFNDDIQGWDEGKTKEKSGIVTITNGTNKEQKFLVDKRKAELVYLDGNN